MNKEKIYTAFFAQNDNITKNIYGQFIDIIEGKCIENNKSDREFWKIELTDQQANALKNRNKNKKIKLKFENLTNDSYFNKVHTTKSRNWKDKGAAIFNITSDYFKYENREDVK